MRNLARLSTSVHLPLPQTGDGLTTPEFATSIPNVLTNSAPGASTQLHHTKEQSVELDMAKRTRKSPKSSPNKAPRTEAQVGGPSGSRHEDTNVAPAREEAGPSGSRPEDTTPNREETGPSRSRLVDTSEITDSTPILEGFKGLENICKHIIEAVQTPKSAAQEQSIPLIETRKEHLVQLRTSLLPSLKEELVSLLRALDVDAAIGRVPETNLRAALQIIYEIKRIVNQITHVALEISPSDELPDPNGNDRDNGSAKTYRCRAVVQKVTELLVEYVACTMNHYHTYVKEGLHLRTCLASPDLIVGLTDGTCETIDELIQYCKRSDFQLLQEGWRSRAESIVEELKTSYLRLSVRKIIEEQRQEYDTEKRDANRRSKQKAIDKGDVGSDDDRNSSSFGSPGGSIGFNKTPRYNPLDDPLYRKVVQSVIPLAKVTRVLIAKLSASKGKVAFKLDGLSSADMKIFQDAVTSVRDKLANLLEEVSEQGEIRAGYAPTIYRTLCSMCHQLQDETNALVVLIGFYIAPDSPSDHPQNTFADHFSEWRISIRLATDNFVQALDEMVKGVPAPAPDSSAPDSSAPDSSAPDSSAIDSSAIDSSAIDSSF
ncbi:hypothetical protein PSHT_03154 [Puccinia striiformis]|uniref:Uncharacterized protein n=1 Tax=Puccinia striiformis TaxID=27350 RepID=A0A2S4WFY6_9BASI|nr:hypothetical protein PSHT_03154 [Puccinia striiformis]